MKPPISSLAARVPSAGGSPGWYLPVSTPCASGDQTIWEMPFASQTRSTPLSSMRRHSSEYCGWLETGFSRPSSRAIATAASICSAVHSETPQ